MDSFWSALLGAFVGTLGTVVISYVNQSIVTRDQKSLDKSRKAMLIAMLEKRSDDEPWIELNTLQHVIGADRDTTIRLLIECKARGNMKEREVWALQAKAPL